MNCYSPAKAGDQAVEKGADRKMCKTKTEKTELQSQKYNQLKAKAIYKKTSEKSEVFKLFALSSSAVPLYADELEMTKSASFSTALTSLSILYRQADPPAKAGGYFLFFNHKSENLWSSHTIPHTLKKKSFSVPHFWAFWVVSKEINIIIIKL